MNQVKLLQLANGKCPYEEWTDSLSKDNQVRVDAYVKRVARGGGKKNVKPLSNGIFEVKVPVGPGFRIYFGEKENLFIILLLGGDKSSQKRDIEKAKEYWRQYNEN